MSTLKKLLIRVSEKKGGWPLFNIGKITIYGGIAGAGVWVSLALAEWMLKLTVQVV